MNQMDVIGLTPREWQEQREEAELSPYSVISRRTKGREKLIEPCTIRTEFQRDRDRVIHCKSFRRLKYKTQVFLLPDGDHYRTRLTHTLEVAQIARTIARALRLNEDLTEAIALAHDLGHTPFGHIGEEVLAKMVPGGFEHNKQSLRVVQVLENNNQGLNLTFEVCDGILNHKRDGKPSTLEGKVVSYADRIAYLNHDIDDAIRATVLSETELPINVIRIFGNTHGKRIDAMIKDIVLNSFGKNYVKMSEAGEFALAELRSFMFANVYTDPVAKREEQKSRHVVELLYQHFCEQPELLPEEFQTILKKEGVPIAAADFVAGMTDRYAIRLYEDIYVPKSWHVLNMEK